MKQTTANATAHTMPVVPKSNPKDWYVFFQFVHNGKTYDRKIRDGINHFDLKQISREAEGLRMQRKTN